jgi:lysophospholipase L1-like esterase
MQMLAAMAKCPYDGGMPKLVAFVPLLLAACAAVDVAGPPPTSAIPVPRDGNWLQRVNEQLTAARAGGHRIAFLGDSITAGWSNDGRRSWQEVFAPRGAINLGISGDRTQHVLWRLDHGLAAALAAPNNDVRLAVVMIGTNNSNGDDHTAEEIGAGIGAVVRRLRTALPNANVLLLAIFPRGERPGPQRDKNAVASRLAAEAFAGDGKVLYRDLGDQFFAADGALSKDVMLDWLHLNELGYMIWAGAIVADVDRLAQ